jgi:hypothetical protein
MGSRIGRISRERVRLVFLTTRELAFATLNDWRLPIAPQHVEILIELAELSEHLKESVRQMAKIVV